MKYCLTLTGTSLYLQSISRAAEGVVCIFISGIADFTRTFPPRCDSF
jgi:hypothetical protein